MSLSKLAAFAAAPVRSQANRKSLPAIWEQSVEEVRARVLIRNRYKTVAEDGSQNLKLTVGSRVLSLGVIKAGAMFIVAAADQVEEFTTLLQAGIDAGDFDGVIADAQAAAKVTAEKAKNVEGSKGIAPEGVDLTTLDSGDTTVLENDDLG